MADGKDNMERIRKNLIAAGIKEENLSDRDTVDIYNALMESEKTAKANGLSVSKNEEPQTISTIFHEPKYTPAFYFDEKLLKLSVKQRKQQICEFHYEVHRKIHEAQRKSLLLVPWGRPISATTKEKFNGLLLKQEQEEEEPTLGFEEEKKTEVEEEEEKKEDDVYISHSGRQTKRKCYADDASVAVQAKKIKSPQVQSKYKGRKKLTNEEIMKRSSLFQDTPKTYTDKIFDELVNIDKKRQQEEEEMKRFEMTLDQIEEDEAQDVQNGNDEKSSSADEDPSYEEPPKRRRIVPPNPFKRKLSTKKTTTISDKQPQDREVQHKKNNNRTAPPTDLNANVEKKPSGGVNSPEPCTSNGRTVRSRGGAKAKKQCPICGKAFDSEKVEAHAATCGEEVPSDHEEQSIMHHIRDISTLSCALCDKTFLMNEDYNNHVQSCIEEHSRRA